MAKKELSPGQAGGYAVVKKYGPKHMSKIGKLGGKAVVKKYGPDYMTKLAKLGGKAIIKIYGSGYMALLGQLSWADTPKARKTIERRITRYINAR